MKASVRGNSLHIWRDEIGGLEVRVTGKSNKSLENLANQINTKKPKFYPAIEEISRMKNAKIEYRNNDKTNFVSGMPNSLKSTPELEILDKSPKNSISREKKDPPAWLDYVKSDIKRQKSSIDSKEAKSDDGSVFRPYSREIYDGYAEGFVKFWKQNPKYKAPSYEKTIGLSSFLTKGAMFGWRKKLENEIKSGKKEPVAMGAWHGKMKAFDEAGTSALLRAGATQEIISKNTKEDNFEDEYLIDEKNNEIFSNLSKKEREDLYKLMNLSQKEINGIERGIGMNKNKDAGSLLSFNDILKEAKLTELENRVSGFGPLVKKFKDMGYTLDKAADLLLTLTSNRYHKEEIMDELRPMWDNDDKYWNFKESTKRNYLMLKLQEIVGKESLTSGFGPYVKAFQADGLTLEEIAEKIWVLTGKRYPPKDILEDLKDRYLNENLSYENIYKIAKIQESLK